MQDGIGGLLVSPELFVILDYNFLKTADGIKIKTGNSFLAKIRV